MLFLLLVLSLRDREVLAERGSLCLSVHTPPSLHLSVTLSISRYTHTPPSLSLSLSLCASLPLHMSLCLSLYTLVCAYRERHREGLRERERERDVCVEEDLSLSSKNETLIQRAKKTKARIKYMKGFDLSVRFAFFAFFTFSLGLKDDERVFKNWGKVFSL